MLQVVRGRSSGRVLATTMCVLLALFRVGALIVIAAAGEDAFPNPVIAVLLFGAWLVELVLVVVPIVLLYRWDVDEHLQRTGGAA